jgi:hypothetical protein
MRTTIKPYEKFEEWEDGDWAVKFYFEDAILLTTVGAGNPDSALYQAMDRLSDFLAVEQPEEVVIELAGVYK